MSVLSAYVSSIEELLQLTLAEIQLPSVKRKTALKRFQIVRTALEKSELELVSRVVDIYPHGSARIGAVISSVGDQDQHDVDGMVEFLIPRNTAPQTILASVAECLEGIAPSLKIKSRCVQLRWADMHIDATPSLLLVELPYRSSQIFDREADRHGDQWPISNPEGFAQWFLDKAGDEYSLSVKRFFDRPEANEFPEQRPGAVSGLQLIKRYRNVTYETRDESDGVKRPPSILLTYFAGMASPKNLGMLGNIKLIADRMICEISAAEQMGTLIHVESPMCRDEKLTDRWPRNRIDQRIWLASLRALVEKLDSVQDSSLGQQLSLLKELFGEEVSHSAFDKYRDKTFRRSRTAGLATTSTGAVVPIDDANTVALNTARHYGPIECRTRRFLSK